MFKPFSPLGASQTISVTTSAAETALSATVGLANGEQLRVVNTGVNPAFIRFLKSANEAAADTSTGHILPAGSSEVWTPPTGTTRISAISTGGSTSLNVTPGNGY